MADITFDQIVAAGSAALAPTEYWCVYHPDGPLQDSAAKDFITPIKIVCGALNADWDDLTEQGFHLGKITIEPVSHLTGI